MGPTSPFYTPRQDVYHNNNRCTEGNNIESHNRRAGTGGKRLCHHCAILNRVSALRHARRK
jgi:hypothetical protein